MKTDYKNYTPAFRKNPASEEIAKSIGTYIITAEITEDKNTLQLFNHVPGLIAFLCTLKIGNQLIGEGRGSATLNKMFKYVDRQICYAKNASIIDAIVRSTKALDVLYLATPQKETVSPIEELDLEGRDNQTFYGDDDMPSFATDKQKMLLKKLLTKCKDSQKEDYLQKLSSPYLTKYECSSIIKTLLPTK